MYDYHGYPCKVMIGTEERVVAKAKMGWSKTTDKAN